LGLLFLLNQLLLCVVGMVERVVLVEREEKKSGLFENQQWSEGKAQRPP